MFQLNPPGPFEIERRISAARRLPASSPPLLTLAGGPISPVPKGFAHDLSRSELAPGRAAFVDARQAMQHWAQFDLGWVAVANPHVLVAVGEVVAVLAHAAGLWSLNLCRIMETIDTATHFGFLYATTATHIEEGQERFLIELDEEHGSVTYLVEALSRPRHPLAWLAYPFARAMQRRFARESHARMSGAVAGQ